MASTIPYVIPIGKDKPKIITLVPNDPGSRYKTRQLQVQVVGKSKMIKTVLVNILDVAKDMQVPPSYIGTFMGYYIGAQAKFDVKKPERQQAFISGEHEVRDLSEIMLKFLNEVVLCPVCGLPEILLSYEGKKVMGKCRACGGNSEMPITNEKFKNYIQKNPPGGNTKTDKAAFKGNTAAATDKPEKVKKEKKSKKKEVDEDEDDDDVVWYTDTSEEAARKRREEMVPEAIATKTDEAEVQEFVNVLSNLSIQSEVFDKFKSLKKNQELTEDEFYHHIFAAMFNDASDLQTPIKTHAAILKYYLKKTEIQTRLLKFLDNLAGTVNTALAPKISLALKDLYDEDMLEEETLLNWYKNENPTPLVKEKLVPLIKWLEEAEEEDEDDEDEEEDDDEEDDE